MLTQEGPSGEISKDLIELRGALNQINPHEMGQVGFMGKILSKLPLVGDRALKTLEKIAIRYEPISKQVSVIETKLREGRAMLARDNVELRKLYEQVESQQTPIQKNAYMGELVMEQLDGVLKRTEDLLKMERVRNVLHDVSMRGPGLAYDGGGPYPILCQHRDDPPEQQPAGTVCGADFGPGLQRRDGWPSDPVGSDAPEEGHRGYQEDPRVSR